MDDLDRQSPVPLYHQLEEWLEGQIRSGTWGPGDQVPTETDLQERFDVSRITVSRAINDLVNRGLLYRVQGKGTFVPDRKQMKNTTVNGTLGLHQEMAKLGLKVTTDVLTLARIVAPEAIGTRLQLPEETAVWKLRRLRKVEGKPFAVQTTYLSAERFPSLQRQDLRDNLFPLETKDGRVTPSYGEEIYRAAVVETEPRAKRLGVTLGSPVLWRQRLSLNAERTPLEMTQSLLRADVYQAEVEITYKDDGSGQ